MGSHQGPTPVRTVLEQPLEAAGRVWPGAFVALPAAEFEPAALPVGLAGLPGRGLVCLNSRLWFARLHDWAYPPTGKCRLQLKFALWSKPHLSCEQYSRRAR